MEYNKKVWINGELITEDALNNVEDGVDSLYTKIAEVETDLENLHAKDEELNDQLAYKANKDFYEVEHDGTEINTDGLQEAINNGYRYIKFPSNQTLKMETTIYLLNHCKIYGENTTLYKDDENSPFFSNIIPSGGTRIEGVEINKIEFKKNSGDSYHIELVEPYKCKIYKCKFIGDPNTNGEYIKSGVKFEKINSDTCFVNYIEKCYFSRASIFMMGTDSYIRNNVVWGYTQEEAIRLKSCSNIDISNNQIIGSSINGAIYGDIEGSANGACRIVNNFFDGSYDEINSGNGLNGSFTLTVISNNTFYNQSANAIRLVNPNRNDISNNTFTENNKHGEGQADILFEYTQSTSMMNNITGNTFNNTRSNSEYYCIKEFRNDEVSPTVYNQYLNNIASIGVTYTDFNNGQTSGTIDNNKFKSSFISNKTILDKVYGVIETSYENTNIDYNISGGCCSVYITISSGNITVPAGGSIILCKVISELYPCYEVNAQAVEHNKTSKLRATLTTDGDLKINNWNATSEGEQVINDLKVTLTYALK